MAVPHVSFASPLYKAMLRTFILAVLKEASRLQIMSRHAQKLQTSTWRNNYATKGDYSAGAENIFASIESPFSRLCKNGPLTI